jgi:glycosyltransferase involved in cell wall biosynthesis
MKICHVNLATGFSGGEQQTLLLIEHQLASGYELRVVARNDSPFAQRIRQLPCQLTEIPHFLHGHRRSLTDHIQVIHVHEGRAVYWALLQHILFGTPYLITRRIDNPLKRKYLLLLAYRRACHIVGLSQAIKSAIESTCPEVSVTIIPSSPKQYSVNGGHLATLKEQFAGKFVVLQAARFHAHKGHEVSVEAARILADEAPDIALCLVGDGPELERIRHLAEGLGNMYLPGQQTNIGDWFALADVLIHPSHSEGLGSVILEANQAGLPVIASRAGGIPDIVHEDENGYLIRPGCARDLADRILGLHRDPERKNRLSKSAARFVDRFDIRHAAAKYDALYRTCSGSSESA